jgi:hypothetical protein
MVTVEFDTSSLTDKLSNASTELISKTLEYTAEDLIRNLMINSPVDHGLLKQWAITEQSDLEITVQSPAEYAVYQNYGTQPYDIYPKNRQYLWWPGAPHPVKHVSHPGIQGKHFVEDSIEAVTPRLEEFFHKAKEEVLP